MRLKYSAVAIITAGVVILVCSTRLSPALAATSEPPFAWVLTQETWEVGKVKLYMTTNAIRMDLLQGTLTCKGPDWKKIVMFNTADKTRYDTEIGIFDVRGVGIYSDVRKAYFSRGVKEEKGKFAGRSCNLVVSNRVENSTSHVLPFQSAVGREKIGIPFVGAIAYTANDFPVSPGGLRFLRACYKFPKANGVPLALELYRKDGKIARQFYTTSIERRRIEASNFDCPKGYKGLPSSELIIGGQGIHSMIQDMLE